MRCTNDVMEPPDDVTLRSHEDNARFRRDPTIESLTDSCLTVVEGQLSHCYLSEDAIDSPSDEGSVVSYEDHTLTSAPRHALERRELLPSPDYRDDEDEDEEEDGSCASYTSYTSDSQTSDPGQYTTSSDNRPETGDEWSDLDVPPTVPASSCSFSSSSCSPYACSTPDTNPSAKSTTLGSEDSGFEERQHELWRHLNSCPRQASPHHNPHHHRHRQESIHIAPSSSLQPDSKTHGNSITEFITRNLFPRSVKRWSLFKGQTGSSSSRSTSSSPSPSGPSPSGPSPSTASPCSDSRSSPVNHKQEVMSTSALVLQPRPCGLPTKSHTEAERHRQQYNDILTAVRNKEIRLAREKRKMLNKKHKMEDQLSKDLRFWRNEILPEWDNSKNLRRTRELWWNGIPASVRGEVWIRAIGNDLNVTPELYEICSQRAKDRLKSMAELNGDTDSITSVESVVSKEGSVELIQLDVSRTFPQLCIFQEGGPYNGVLHNLLAAYVCYRPDVGYVQGMSFIAAVLLLNMKESEAFVCFANLLNQPCIVAFFRLDESLVSNYFTVYEQLFQENLPDLYVHFAKQEITSELYVIDWIFTIFARSLPLDVASRVWDVFFRDGESFLFKMALGILKLYQKQLASMEFMQLAQFLTRLPDSIPSDLLFKCVENIRTGKDGCSFAKLLCDASIH